MGILNRFFGDPESLAKEMDKDSKLVKKAWMAYQVTLPRKVGIASNLTTENCMQKREMLVKLLQIELVDLDEEQRKNSEIVADLSEMLQQKRIEHVEKLHYALGYAESKYMYVDKLLHQIYMILLVEMHLINVWGPDQIVRFKQQVALEQSVLQRIGQIQTFHQLFAGLAKCEHIEHRLTQRENVLCNKIKQGMADIFSDNRNRGLAKAWADRLMDKFWDSISESMAANGWDNHQDADLQFVNSPDFEMLAEACFRELRLNTEDTDLSRRFLKSLIHIFRDWYSFERPRD